MSARAKSARRPPVVAGSVVVASGPHTGSPLTHHNKNANPDSGTAMLMSMFINHHRK